MPCVPLPGRIAVLLLCALLLFTACAPGQPQPEEPETVETDVLPWEEGREEEEPDEVDEPEEDFSPRVYRPEEPLELEETVLQYFEQQYQSYIALAPIDISALLDMSQQGNQNLLVWLEMLAMRRRLIWQENFCYVERERFDYQITYIDQDDLEDDRMLYWDTGWIGEEETVLHFVITGQEGCAYPPTLALNAQHTMRLRQNEEGSWQIIFHYFPGSARKFYLNDSLTLPEEGEMLFQLQDEFAPADQPEEQPLPEGAAAYDGALAAAYALRYTEQANGAFYHVGDWTGNCANFTSQCVWYGFGDGEMPSLEESRYMTADWYAGEGGGTPAWESVEAFWDCITGGGALAGRELDSAELLREGDLIQTKAGVALPQEVEGGGMRYNHMLIVAEAQTLLLAQNSPACFVYYSDLVGVETRYVRPESVRG